MAYVRFYTYIHVCILYIHVFIYTANIFMDILYSY